MSKLGWQYLTPQDKETILRGIRDGVAYGGPYHVEIHPADRCNIECFFCSTAAIRGTDELPFQRMEQLIDEFEATGVRAIRFAGGGEPLFHRKFKDVVRRIVRSGIPIENITTNAVLLDEELARLLTLCCDEVTVSLNTMGAASYAKMMQTPERNYERVLRNIQKLIEVRGREKRPNVTLQFLIWKENYASIPGMYALARELGVDSILFNGLAFLPKEQQMTDAETKEMLALYEQVVRIDEFRRIRVIGSYERDISADVRQVVDRLAGERARQPFLHRLMTFLNRGDFTLREKLAHRRRIRRSVQQQPFLEQFPSACIIGWYSLLIRSTGQVAPCCILQSKILGNVMTAPLQEVWQGDGYGALRGELTRLLTEGNAWQPDASNRTLEAVCGAGGSDSCQMKSFYYASDEAFSRPLLQAVSRK